MKKIFTRFLNIIFPPRCLACGKKTGSSLICNACLETIGVNNGFYCPRCEKRLFESGKPCHSKENFVIAAAASYKDPAVRKLIYALKYHRLKPAVEPLVEILENFLAKIRSGFSFDAEKTIIVSIPLYSKKEKERGFNQSFLIAKKLSEKSLPAPVENSVLFRIKNTASQMELSDYEKRAENVKNCFAVKNKEKIKDKNVILVDDVFTSGATMREAVRILKENGAKKIVGLVIAKA